MPKKKQLLVLIHTIHPLVEVFKKLGEQILPGVELLHILDEPLLKVIRDRGRLTAGDSQRVSAHIAAAVGAGAGAVLVTCSTISPCVDDLRRSVPIPVLKIDEAMIAEAVGRGERIGVAATNAATLDPTQTLLLEQAQVENHRIEIQTALVEGAFSALLRGDIPAHDELVRAAVKELSGKVDVVVLAQASMARSLEGVAAGEGEVPILSSPRLALERIREIFETQQQPTSGGV